MTIDEAIEIFEDYESFGTECTHPKLPEAIKLGNEALKRIKAQRQQYPEISSRPIPGED